MKKEKLKEQGVLVFCEHNNNDIEKVSLELIDVGNRLAKKLKSFCSVVIMGKKINDVIEQLQEYEFENLIIVENELLMNKDELIYTDALSQVVNKYTPQIFLIGATRFGKSLAPRLSTRLNTGLTADCTELDIENINNRLIQIRPAFEEEKMAVIDCRNSFPQMATVKEGIFAHPKKCKKNNLKKTYFNVDNLQEPSLKIIRTEKKKNSVYHEYNKNRKVTIGIGRGIKTKKNLDILINISKIMDTNICCTRAVVDMGLMDESYQVGQTGKIIETETYIAFGISGSLQHMEGIKAKKIIAINKDKNARIFKVSSLGILADVEKVLSEMLSKINKL